MAITNESKICRSILNQPILFIAHRWKMKIMSWYLSRVKNRIDGGCRCPTSAQNLSMSGIIWFLAVMRITNWQWGVRCRIFGGGRIKSCNRKQKSTEKVLFCFNIPSLCRLLSGLLRFVICHWAIPECSLLDLSPLVYVFDNHPFQDSEIGRASCRERVEVPA